MTSFHESITSRYVKLLPTFRTLNDLKLHFANIWDNSAAFDMAKTAIYFLYANHPQLDTQYKNQVAQSKANQKDIDKRFEEYWSPKRPIVMEGEIHPTTIRYALERELQGVDITKLPPNEQHEYKEKSKRLECIKLMQEDALKYRSAFNRYQFGPEISNDVGRKIIYQMAYTPHRSSFTRCAKCYNLDEINDALNVAYSTVWGSAQGASWITELFWRTLATEFRLCLTDAKTGKLYTNISEHVEKQLKNNVWTPSKLTNRLTFSVSPDFNETFTGCMNYYNSDKSLSAEDVNQLMYALTYHYMVQNDKVDVDLFYIRHLMQSVNERYVEDSHRYNAVTGRTVGFNNRVPVVPDMKTFIGQFRNIVGDTLYQLACAPDSQFCIAGGAVLNSVLDGSDAKHGQAIGFAQARSDIDIFMNDKTSEAYIRLFDNLDIKAASMHQQCVSLVSGVVPAGRAVQIIHDDKSHSARIARFDLSPCAMYFANGRVICTPSALLSLMTGNMYVKNPTNTIFRTAKYYNTGFNLGMAMGSFVHLGLFTTDVELVANQTHLFNQYASRTGYYAPVPAYNAATTTQSESEFYEDYLMQKHGSRDNYAGSDRTALQFIRAHYVTYKPHDYLRIGRSFNALIAALGNSGADQAFCSRQLSAEDRARVLATLNSRTEIKTADSKGFLKSYTTPLLGKQKSDKIRRITDKTMIFYTTVSNQVVFIVDDESWQYAVFDVYNNTHTVLNELMPNLVNEPVMPAAFATANLEPRMVNVAEQ